MSIDLGDDILQDFLVEAGEILEQLDEQLIDLEQDPDDKDLLNSIFRGFHTIKGGGGFLALNDLVELCHKSEDLFNLLRNGEKRLNEPMMDAFLKVLDELNRMFAKIREGEDPAAAPPELLQQLLDFQNESPPEEVEAAPADAEAAESVEMEAKESVEVDAAASEARPESEQKDEVNEKAADDGNMSDDEFEALLDTMQDKSPVADGAKAAKTSTKKVKASNKKTEKSADISDSEFDSLLDNMYGSGKGPTAKQSMTKQSMTDAPPSGAEKLASTATSKTVTAAAVTAPVKESAALPSAKSKDLTAKKDAAKKGSDETPDAADKKADKKASKKAGKSAKKAEGETTVRVNTARLDDIMNLVGELVLARNRLNILKEEVQDEPMQRAIANLDIVTGDLQAAVMKTRMQPVKKVFGKFPRLVRDMARNLGKQISLEMIGEETDLDKNLVEALSDPLIHLVRNSIDHGVELPDVRAENGKSREGSIVLAASQEGDHIRLSITDDGAGINPEILRKKAISSGMMDEETAGRLDDKDCFDLIFMPGLSTAENISDVSGRGVGMDVVKTAITKLNGTIDITSVLGKGTVLSLKVPLTLAILPTLMVRVGERKFALPLSCVNEIFDLQSKQTNIVDGREIIQNRGKAPPLFRLRDWLLNGAAKNEPINDSPQVIMVSIANTVFGLVVDHVLGQEEVVIKPLGALLHGLPGMAGSTVTGDGNIAIILDVHGLMRHYA